MDQKKGRHEKCAVVWFSSLILLGSVLCFFSAGVFTKITRRVVSTGSLGKFVFQEDGMQFDKNKLSNS